MKRKRQQSSHFSKFKSSRKESNLASSSLIKLPRSKNFGVPEEYIKDFYRFRQKAKIKDFNLEEQKPMEFCDYLRFSHFVLEKQMIDKTNFTHQHKHIKSNRGKYNRVWSADPKDDSMAFAAVRMHFKEIFDQVKSSVMPLLTRQTNKLSREFDFQNYFLDSILCGRDKAKNNVDLKQIQINKDHLFLQKYKRRKKQKDPIDQVLVNKSNQFFPTVLNNERGGREVKVKIEMNSNIKTMRRVEDIWEIGNILGQIHSKIISKIENGNLNKNFGKNDYFEESSQTRELLEFKKNKKLKEFQENIIGKKFLEKFQYVKERLYQKEAERFVNQIQVDKQSK
jgi:hypothetical protein